MQRSVPRDHVRELLGAGPSGPQAHGASPAKQRQQEYAAELREQIAAKEAARQQERAHSLRQSAALLELRQAAPSAVLPVVGSGLGISRGATTSTGPHSAPWPALHQQHEANPWGPLAHGGSDKGWPPLPGSLGQQQQQAQQHAPQGWAVHDLHPAPSAPPLPLHAEAGWVEPSGRPGHAGPWAQPQSELSYAAGAPIRHSSMLQPPFGVESSGVAAGAQLPLPAPAWNPAVAQAPFGNDLQPPGQPRTRSRSLSNARDGGLASMGSSLPSPWAEAGGGGASSSNGGSMRGWATAGLGQPGSGGPDDKEAARQAAERKRSVYKAELERQMREKEERRRQEQAAERATEARKAAEAEHLLRRAAAGRYGGGSGPLRDADGHPITDLNQVRRFQAAASAQLSPEAGPPLHSAGPSGSMIGAHWVAEQPGPPDAGGWMDGRPGWQLPPMQQHPQQHPQQQQQRQQQQQPPPGFSGWADQAPRLAPPQGPGISSPSRQPSGAAGEWHIGHSAGQDPGWVNPPHQPVPAQFPPAGWPQPAPGHGSDGNGAPSASPAGRSRGSSLVVPAPGGGTETMTVRLRSDRPYQTASEAERRARAQTDFQAALRAQVEEKARLKAEEQRRRKEEEAAEEARLAREQERMRLQFDADQAQQRSKKAAKVAGGADTLESGGVTIKFKPPPAGRRAQPEQQQAHAGRGDDGGMVSPDDVLPGIDIRVKGPPAARRASNPPTGHPDKEHQQEEQQQQQQQQRQQQLEQQQQQALQHQGSGAWAPPAAGGPGTTSAGLAGLPGAAGSAQPAAQLQDAPPAGISSSNGASNGGLGPSPWQQAHQYMQPGLAPLQQAQMAPGPGWQQPWAVMMPPQVFAGCAPGAPNWPPQQHLPLPLQQQMLPPQLAHQQHFLPLQLQPFPPLSGGLGPPSQVQAPWGQPPQLPTSQQGYGPTAPGVQAPPPWAPQQEGQLLPQGRGGAEGPQPGQPWLPPPMPAQCAPSSAPPPASTLQPQQYSQPLPPSQQQQAWAHPAALGPPGPEPDVGAGRQHGGMPVYETRGVLNVRDSRPASSWAADTELLRMGSPMPLLSATGRASLLAAQEGLADTSMPRRTSLTFPMPQPPPAAFQPTLGLEQPLLLEQPLGLEQHSGSNVEGAQAGSMPVVVAGELAQPSPPGRPSEGLAPWDQLQAQHESLELPFSRQTSSTVPTRLPPLKQQQPQQQWPAGRGSQRPSAGGGHDAGSARRRSSWGGLFGVQEPAGVVAGANWPA